MHWQSIHGIALLFKYMLYLFYFSINLILTDFIPITWLWKMRTMLMEFSYLTAMQWVGHFKNISSFMWLFNQYFIHRESDIIFWISRCHISANTCSNLPHNWRNLGLLYVFGPKSWSCNKAIPWSIIEFVFRKFIEFSL